jgi:hypothetical protein
MLLQLELRVHSRPWWLPMAWLAFGCSNRAPCSSCSSSCCCCSCNNLCLRQRTSALLLLLLLQLQLLLHARMRSKQLCHLLLRQRRCCVRCYDVCLVYLLARKQLPLRLALAALPEP